MIIRRFRAMLTLAVLIVALSGCSEEENEELVENLAPLAPVFDFVLDRFEAHDIFTENTIELFPLGSR